MISLCESKSVYRPSIKKKVTYEVADSEYQLAEEDEIASRQHCRHATKNGESRHRNETHDLVYQSNALTINLTYIQKSCKFVFHAVF